MIQVISTKMADSRSAGKKVDINDLERDTKLHINDVTNGLNFIADQIKTRGPLHDHTKLDYLDNFCVALNSPHTKDTEWYKKHITEERHHLLSYVHEDVTLVDVIEHVVDCTMAALARNGGEVYDVKLPAEVLQLAINNTVEMLKANTEVVKEGNDLLDEEL